MHARTTLIMMAENNAWSNHRLHGACASLTTPEIAAERTSFFPSILKTLTHIHLVDVFYLDALERGGRGYSVFDDRAPFAELAPLRLAQQAVDARLLAFCNALANDDAIDAEVLIPRATRVQRDRVGTTLLHLFTHQIHHRGQAHAMLSGTKVAPPQLDDFFLEEDLPIREAELRELGLPLRGRAPG